MNIPVFTGKTFSTNLSIQISDTVSDDSLQRGACVAAAL